MHIRFVNNDIILGEIFDVHPDEVPLRSSYINIKDPIKAVGVVSMIVLDVTTQFEPQESFSSKFSGVESEDPVVFDHWKIVSV